MAVRLQRLAHRSRLRHHGHGDRSSDPDRGGRQEHTASSVRAAAGAQARGDGHGLCSANGTEQQWLAELGAPQAAFLDRRLPGGEQTSADVQAALRLPLEAELPERQEIADDGGKRDQGEQPDRHLDRSHDERLVAQVSSDCRPGPLLGRVDVAFAGGVPHDAGAREDGDDAGGGERREAHPPQPYAGQHGWLLRRGRIDGDRSQRRVVPHQKRVAEPLGLGRSQAVEDDALVLASIRAPGAGGHPLEPERAVEKVSAEVDGTDAVPRDRPGRAVQQPLADLDVVLGHPVRRGRPAEHREQRHDAGPDEAPRRTAGAAVAEQEQGHEDGQRPEQLDERGDQQHPGVQALPGLGHLLRLGRGNDGMRHVASPGAACAVAVRSATSASATTWSSPWMTSGPAADAVVTTTSASPSSCSIGPRLLSTVWIREIGARRRSWVIQPDWTYTASRVASQRCTWYRHCGMTIMWMAATTPESPRTMTCTTTSPVPVTSHSTWTPRITSQDSAARAVQYQTAVRLTRCAGGRIRSWAVSDVTG